jgi:hypothetical protein
MREDVSASDCHISDDLLDDCMPLLTASVMTRRMMACLDRHIRDRGCTRLASTPEITDVQVPRLECHVCDDCLAMI